MPGAVPGRTRGAGFPRLRAESAAAVAARLLSRQLFFVPVADRQPDVPLLGDLCSRARAPALHRKQMRSGPATRTALFWRNVLLPFYARGVEDFTAGIRSEERSPVMPPGRWPSRSKLRDSSAALRWPTASPAVCGGLSEEAATPGQPYTRRSALWRIPPSDSPSGITRLRRLCRNALAGHTEHLA